MAYILNATWWKGKNLRREKRAKATICPIARYTRSTYSAKSIFFASFYLHLLRCGKRLRYNESRAQKVARKNYECGYACIIVT